MWQACYEQTYQHHVREQIENFYRKPLDKIQVTRADEIHLENWRKQRHGVKEERIPLTETIEQMKHLFRDATNTNGSHSHHRNSRTEGASVPQAKRLKGKTPPENTLKLMEEDEENDTHRTPSVIYDKSMMLTNPSISQSF